MRKPKGQEYISLQAFSEINLDDSFFNSLKVSYPEFEVWFRRKADTAETAFITVDEEGIQAFLYLKEEQGPIDNISPAITDEKVLKIGTFKINPHQTKLGERFVKKVIDQALLINADSIYVTIFPSITSLIELLKRYGFVENGNKPDTGELVLVKKFSYNFGLSPNINYPMVEARGVKKYLIGIWPKYHTRLFPDSILTTENYNKIHDESHTNSIHKVYLCAMEGVTGLTQNDLLIIYRTADRGRGQAAEYTSVATSLCSVTGVEDIRGYPNMKTFIDMVLPYSVFTEEELVRLYKSQRYPYIIWFTYNSAFTRRITRHDLIEINNLDRSAYWGFMELNDTQFFSIIESGGVNERIVIH